MCCMTLLRLFETNAAAATIAVIVWKTMAITSVVTVVASTNDMTV